MASEQENFLEKDPEFLQLRTLWLKMAIGFSIFTLAIFVAFIIGIISFADIVAARLSDGGVLTVAIALAFLVILLPVFIAAVFMRRMDRTIEPMRARLAKRRRP
ncbi:MAG: DUF485 domain-containing protein [Proteobacteria bacterium]|nr:DUF485 domain-containing protein [Pseudomonadota bacterium]